ncbi:ATP-binding cassette transporter [Coprinopsis cinerea AmutBmut pab1-1]|nr:ATP-binding cassette transporter [Coprinopsis cinerea AmutBmut pab1-1]
MSAVWFPQQPLSSVLSLPGALGAPKRLQNRAHKHLGQLATYSGWRCPGVLDHPRTARYHRIGPDTTELGEEANIVSDFSEHVKLHGGATIFAFRVLRLLACIALLGLFVYSSILDEQSSLYVIFGDKKKKGGRKHRDKTPPKLTEQEWIDMMLSMTSFYLVSLATVVLAATPRWSRIANHHLTLVLFAFLAVYVSRDVYPLITFNEIPMDQAEGWVLWAKVGSLFLSACIVPLFIPRQYTPIYPEEPTTANPEQTTSLFSLATYSFLDPVIVVANKLPTLPSDLLPPLADYDSAKHLKSRSFPHVDAFSRAHKRHIFFGLMRVFRTEYMILGFMMLVQVLAGFASPLGVKYLLRYIETNGAGATIKPWFWILWLFLGPFIASLAFQWYIFIATRTLVRTEGILTQLIFEHALRIRVKAEAPEDLATKTPGPVTPDSASAPGTPIEPSELGTDHSHLATDSTLVASSSEGTFKPTGSDSGTDAALDAASMKPASQHDDGSSNAQNLVGKINNLVTTDLNNIVDARDFLYIVIWIPLQITLCIVFLYNVLGWSSFVGLAAMLLLFPVPSYVAKLMQDVQTARLKKTDARVEIVSEAMNVVRMIKLFGWEKKMNDRIAEKREVELYYLWKRNMLELVNGSLNYLIPTTVMKRELTASIVFSSMTVFDMLREQLNITFWSLTKIIAGRVSLDRVNDFLNNTELLDQFADSKEPSIVPPSLVTESQEIGFHDASFAWSRDTTGSLTPSKRQFRLKIENDLFFPRGQLSIIIGPTGSGKTSLLMALLGEMHFVPMAPDSWFSLPRSGGIAYAAQESWVQNETIRENILFGAPYDEERYNKVIYQCSLARDLSLFEAGDQTEVGEKGLTLSGGQKARITLARAIYSRAEILLLDDVLAALDVHTSKWIVEKCFAGDLVKGRTMILVTHNVALASSVAEFAVSLGGDGKVLAQGPISEVVKHDKRLIKQVNEEERILHKSEEEIDPKGKAPPDSADGKLIVEEEVEEGHVSWSAVKMFFSAMGGVKRPQMFFILYMTGIVLCEVVSVAQTWWLGYWASQYSIHPPSEVPVSWYLGFYGALLLVGSIAYASSYAYYIIGSIRASRTLHKQLLEAVLGTTLRWLDTTPISRVITRCTQDIRTVDGPLADQLWYLSEMTYSMLIKFGAVLLFTPVFLLPGIIVATLGGWCGQIYIKAQLSVKREMSNAKAPVLGHFGAAIAGLTSLRAYGAQQAFIEESLKRINRYTRAARVFYNLNRWICIRVDVLGGLFASSLAAYLIYFRDHSASNIGFSLNMAVGFSTMILWWIRIVNEFEVQGNSLERIGQYTSIEQEPKPTLDGIPPAYWPAEGSLHVENLSARYSPDGPKVLRDLSFDIRSGERVGVVGRTGSGKSSLTLALLRCIFTEGKVVYAGKDTNSLNLDALRSNITIIPQIPELLSGSLRQNLDPFDQYDDALLNDALRSAGLFSLQEGVEEGKLTLDSAISSGGGNLSVGQRQIIALARAIIRGKQAVDS